MKFKKILTVLSILLTFLCPIFSQGYSAQEIEKLSGQELYQYIKKTLDYNGYSHSDISIFRTENDTFARNIVLHFPAKKELPDDIWDSAKDTIILSFMQEDIATRTDFLFNIIEFIKESEFNYNINILLTAADKSILSGNEENSGSALYCDLFKGTGSTAAILVSFSSTKRNSITPGSGQILCPLWLIKSTAHSLEAKGIRFSIKGGIFCSLYSHDILKSDYRLASYLSNGIEALDINFNEDILKTTTLSEVFTHFLENYSPEKSENQDTHYIPLKFFNHTYFIPEIATMLLLYIITAIGLFLICDFTFLFSTKQSIKPIIQKESIHSIWILPLTWIIGFASIYSGQYIASIFFKYKFYNPILLITIKLIVTFLLITIFFLIFLKIKKNNQIHVFEYILTISAIFNIFVFCAFDIALFYLFTTIYLIVYFSRNVKKIHWNFICLFLMVIPFFPLLTRILLYSTPKQIFPLIFSNPGDNFILAFALGPFSLMWFKIILRIQSLTIEAKEIKQQHAGLTQNLSILFPRYYILVISLFTVLTLVLSLIISINARKLFSNIEPLAKMEVIEETPQNENLSVSYSDSKYYSGNIRTVNIKTNRQAVRVDVIVSGQTENPIYYTFHQYSPYTTAYQAKFNIPDYPPKNFTITYTPDVSQISTIEVHAYYLTDDTNPRRNFFAREKSVTVIDYSQGDKK